MTVSKAANSTASLIEEEAAPLLSPTDLDASSSPSLPAKPKNPWIALVATILLLIVIVDIGSFLSEPPKTRVYEANICLAYYEENDPSRIGPDGSVDEALCKGDAIQKKLAMIFGWQELFDAVPSLLLAVPYGALADQWGRKWVFAASLIGLQLSSAWLLLICYFQSLPLQLTWLSSAFQFIGGGSIVAVAVALTMISDIVPPEQRTTVFLYLSAGTLISEMVAPVIAAYLMQYGNWFPLLLALGLQGAGMTIAIFIPETLHLRNLAEPTDEDIDPETELRVLEPNNSFTVKAQLRQYKDAITFMRRDKTMMLVIFTFLASRLGRQSLNLLIRYASKRYSWKLSEAAYLLSFRAATNLVALTIICPIINLVLLKVMRLPAHWADLWLSRGSVILLTASFFIMGIAAHPALLITGLLVYNMGTGYSPAMRSISIHLVGGQTSPDLARLFAVIAIVESFGAMLAGPILAGFLEHGIALGEPWIGMPYIASAVIFVGITILSFMITFKPEEIVVYAPLDDAEIAIETEASLARGL